MKNRSKIIWILLFLLPVIAVDGQVNDLRPVEDPDLVSERIVESNRGISTLQCKFEQEKELSFLEETVFSSGRFYFERESKIRWEYQEPYSYVIIMNGSMIRIEDEGKTNTLDASSNRLFSSMNNIMSGIIDGSVIQRQDQFTASLFENKTVLRVLLEPVMSGMKEFINRIEIDLNKTDYSVDMMKIIENTGDYTRIEYKNKKFNEPIPEDLFSIH